MSIFVLPVFFCSCERERQNLTICMKQLCFYASFVLFVHFTSQRLPLLDKCTGYGFVHNGSRAQDVCSTLDMFFPDRVGEVKYSVSKLKKSKWVCFCILPL